MARQKTQVEYNNFTKGYITEASPLTFPENASLDEENMNINRDGSRQRRFGMTWEALASTLTVAGSSLATNGYATSSFTWRSAGNDGDTNIGVFQVGRTLYFYDLDDEPASSLVLTTTFTTGEVPSPYHQRPWSYTAAYGRLIISTGDEDVIVFTKTGPTAYSWEKYRLKVRDRWGVEDGFAIDYRPVYADINQAHIYNLRNQGWPLEIKCAELDQVTQVPLDHASLEDPLDWTQAQVGFWPSNADLIWANKCDNIGTATQISNLGAYNPWNLEKIDTGTTAAPKGRIVLDVFNRGASRFAETAITGLPDDETVGGITAVATFAGRVWYSVREDSTSGTDDRSPSIGNMVFYSKASEDQSNWSACHADNDPTVEDYNDPLDSDGGFIAIAGAGSVYDLVPLGESLFVFTSNGVWEIFGGDTGFSAKVQSVVRVTDIGCLSASSILAGDNLIAYWSESGIYGVSLDQSSLRGVATNITEQTIQQYYDDIPLSRKKVARGHYDAISKQALWLYSETNLGSDYYFDRELVFDTASGGFTKRKLGAVDRTAGATGPYPTVHLGLRTLVRGITTETVLDELGADVTDILGEDVYITISDAEQGNKSSTRYFVADFDGTDEKFRMGGYLDTDFKDWGLVLDATTQEYGADAEAFLLTGYITAGDSSRDKWMPYVTTRLKRTESSWSEDGQGVLTLVGESSCLLQAQWEWTNNAYSFRWSRPQQTYKLPRSVFFDPDTLLNFDVVATRSKIRGNGKAVSLKFSSEPGKDMYIYGWGMEVMVKADN